MSRGTKKSSLGVKSTPRVFALSVWGISAGNTALAWESPHMAIVGSMGDSMPKGFIACDTPVS